MLETKQLKILTAIADTGSFTRAGERLQLSQTAISQHVRAIEKHLGVALLVRSGQGAHPTAAGAVLLEYARQVLGKLDEAERLLGAHRRGEAGMLHIATGAAASVHLIPPVVRELQRAAPKVQVHVTSGDSARAVAFVRDGSVDLALAPLPIDGGTLRVREVGCDELVVIVSPAHAWAGRARAAVRELAREPLVLHARASATTDLLMRHLLAEGVFPRIVAESDQLDAVAALVRAHVGIAVVPRWAVRADVARGELRALRLGREGITRAWGVVTADRSHPTATVRQAVALCLDRLPDLLRADHGIVTAPQSSSSVG